MGFKTGLYCIEQAAASSTSGLQAQVGYETRNAGELNEQTPTQTETILAFRIWNDSRTSVKQSVHVVCTLEKIATIENRIQLTCNMMTTTYRPQTRNVFSWCLASPRQIGRHSDHHEWATNISTAALKAYSAEIFKQNIQQSQGKGRKQEIPILPSTLPKQSLLGFMLRAQKSVHFVHNPEKIVPLT